jgi:3-oxoacyl-[acyl-carrier-protein] synthase II
MNNKLMSKEYFNILSQSVFCPGQDASAISELRPGKVCGLDHKEASKMLGRKGLRYKDEATLLALVAAKKIIDAAPPMTDEQKSHTAVIVSSNFCNFDTVIINSQIIAEKHVDETSPMSLPNASSNVVSASISIIYELRGPNLMLCNGNNSGLDALILAQDLMQAKRAERVLMIGVEVDNEIVRALIPARHDRFHGAVGYLIEMVEPNSNPEYEILAKLHATNDTNQNLSIHEVSRYCGDASAATGVMQVMLAAEHARCGRARCLTKGGSAWLVEGP